MIERTSQNASNGWAAMIGVVAAMGSYANSQVKLSQVYGERHVTHSSIHGRRVRICCPIDRWRR